MLRANAIFLLTYLLFLQGAADAPQRGTVWQQESQAAATAADGADNQARIRTLSKLHSDFPENSRVLRNLAWAEQRAGNTSRATSFLKDYAQMGMSLPHGGPIYEAMAKAGLLGKVPQLQQNEAVISKGEKLFALPDSDLLVEDIAFDSKTGRYLLTSAHEKKIVSCDQLGNCQDVVTSGPKNELDGMLAVRVDADRNVLWATTAGMSMQQGFRPEHDGRSVVLKFDLKTFRLLKAYHPGDGRKHALGDMTVASNGDAYVCDGLSGDVYVIRKDSDKLETLVPPGVFISPQTPALNESESLLYVPDYVEGIAVIDLSTRKISWVKATAPLALEGIDGLYWTKTGLIAIQNGTSPERVARFHMSDERTLDTFSTVEANWPELGDPTHGTIVGRFFYFIANSGWDRVVEDQSVLKPGKAAQVWRVPLP